MRIPRAVVLLSVVVLMTTTGAAQQTHGDPSGLHARGHRFMGFDQGRTTHHFVLRADGGRIEVTAKDGADRESIAAIREHLQHIAGAFGKGDFNLPGLVHDTRSVPGVDGMRSHQSDLAFTFEEVARGGRVRITAASPAALAAVHEFLRFQITDHRTGDPLNVR